MVRIEKLANGTPYVVHDGTYECCADCKARLEADDAAHGATKRAAARDGQSKKQGAA